MILSLIYNVEQFRQCFTNRVHFSFIFMIGVVRWVRVTGDEGMQCAALADCRRTGQSVRHSD